MGQPPVLVVVRDEMWELLAKADDPTEVVEAEATHHGLTAKQLLDALARQGRTDVKPRPARLPFAPHRLSDFD